MSHVSQTKTASQRPEHAPSWCPQVRDTLGALAERFAVLRIDAGGLHLSRLARVHSRGLALKRIVMYSPNWVRSQNRMASTSNQARPSCLCVHPASSSHPPVPCSSRGCKLLPRVPTLPGELWPNRICPPRLEARHSPARCESREVQAPLARTVRPCRPCASLLRGPPRCVHVPGSSSRPGSACLSAGAALTWWTPLRERRPCPIA